MKTPYKSLVLVLIVSAFLTIAPMMSSFGATTGGTGQDRFINMDVSGGNYTATSNLSIPETISENHTFEGNLTYEHVQNATGWQTAPSVTFWANITISNATWTSDTYTSGGTTLDGNTTTTYEITTGAPQGNYNMSISLETDGGASDIQNDVSVTVISNTNYMLSYTMIELVTALIPLIVIVAVVIPMITKLFEGFDDDIGGF